MTGTDLSRNSILSRLAREPGFAQIKDRFKLSALHLNKTVQVAGKPMRYLHFPLSGMFSTVADMKDGSTVEICCVGARGMVNWETLFSNDRSKFRHFGQLAGEMVSIPCKHMLEFAFHPAISRYVVGLVAEVSQTAACNRMHNAGERLARWLLMISDKIGSDELPLTQEFLAMMLGARRSTVTIAAGELQTAGFIRYRRGRLRILNRAGLISVACECYLAVATA